MMEYVTEAGNTSCEELLEGHEGYWQDEVADQLIVYVAPVLLVLGLLGNIISLLVMSRPSLRHFITTLYLRSIAVLDTIVLLTGLLHHWLVTLFNFDIRLTSNWMCKLHTFLLCWSGFFSIWLLVACSMERCCGFVSSHHTEIIRSKKATALVVSTVGLLTMSFNVVFLADLQVINYYSSGEVCDTRCAMPDDYSYFWGTVWPWLQLALKCFLPFVFLIISNGIIISRLAHLRMQGHTLTVAKTCGGSDIVASMTVTQLAVSTAFLLTTAPLGAYYLVYDVSNPWLTPQEIACKHLFFSIASILYYMHFSCKVLHYVATAPRFRQEFLCIARMVVCAVKVHPEA